MWPAKGAPAVIASDNGWRGKQSKFPLLHRELFWFDSKWLASINIPERNNCVSLINYLNHCIIEDDWIKTLWLFDLFNWRCTVSPINPSFLPIYCIVVHRGVSIAIRLAWLIKWKTKNQILTTGMMQCPINEDGGWEHCIPYFPVSSQYQTQNRQKRNARPRKVLKINIQIWL